MPLSYLRHETAVRSALGALTAVGIFVLDLVTSLGIPVWVLYGVSFLFLQRAAPPSHVYALAGMCTVLIFAGYLLSPSATQHVPIQERLGAVIIVWFIATVFFRRQRSRESSSS